MEENTVYWVWLTLKNRITPSNITALLERFDSVEGIYNAENYDGIPYIDFRLSRALKNKSLDEAKRVIDQTQRLGAEIVTYDSINFPYMLKNIIDPPYVLYIKGEMFDWEKTICIGVVGTRDMTEYGEAVTAKLASGLAEYGVVVVTGLARGNDSRATRSALNAGGRVIGVVGGGIDVIYPSENEDLYYRVMDNGLLISEYPPGSRPLRHHFPARNRIIAGISHGVLVTEAPGRSGSLITASQALENGRDVFAVPATILKSEYNGTNRLIQQGAKPVLTSGDIVIEYAYDMKKLKIQKPQRSKPVKPENTEKKPKEQKPVKKEYEALEPEERRVMEKLFEGECHIDELSRSLDIPMYKLSTMLTLMEMRGIVTKKAGNIYFAEN